MPKYKEGDTFEATVRIKDGSEGLFLLEVVELEEEITGLFAEDEISEAFDKHFKERKRLERIEVLKKELEQLGGIE